MRYFTVLLFSVLFFPAIISSQTWTLRDDFNRWEHPIDTASPSKWKAVANMNGGLVYLSGAAAMVDSLQANGVYGFAGFDSAFTSDSWQGLIINQPFPWSGTYIDFLQYLRFTSLDYNGTGYRVRWMSRGNYADVSDTVVIERQASSSSRTVIGAATGFEMTAGDTLKWKVSSDNTTITVFKNSTQLLQVTDATYAPSTWYTFFTIRQYSYWNEVTGFLVGTGGAQSNQYPTISSLDRTPTSPNVATADSLLYFTATASDAGPGAGLDSIKIYVDGSLAAQKGAIAGTSDVLSSTPTRYSVGAHTYYAEARDDSGAVTRYPTSGTLSVQVDSNAAASSSLWVTAYFVSWEVNMGSGTTSNYGRMPVDSIQWDALTHAIMFAAGISSVAPYEISYGNMLISRRGPFVNKGHQHGKPVLFGFGGSSLPSATYKLRALGAATTEAAAIDTQVARFLREIDTEGWDGIDFDFEPFSAADTGFIGPMIRKLHDSLQTRSSAYTGTGKKIITAAILPTYGGAVWYVLNKDVMTQINLMTYDMALSLGFGNDRTWHNNGIYCPSPFSWNSGTNRYYTSVQSRWTYWAMTHNERAISGIGIDFNGIKYTGGLVTIDEGVSAPKQIWTSAPTIQGDFDFGRDLWPFLDTASEAIKKLDTEAQAPYLSVIKPPSANPTNPGSDDYFLSYTDSLHVRRLFQYAADSGAGGVILWTYSEGYLSNTSAQRRGRVFDWVLGANDIWGGIDTTTRRITSISPATKVAGEGNFTLSVNGTNLKSGDSVFISGVYRVTSYVSATQLTAAALAADIATTGNKGVYVKNGANTSNTVNLVVTAAPVKPNIVSINPTSVGQGAANISITLAGTDFDADASVTFSGGGITVNSTSFQSVTQVTANITVSSSATTGSRHVYIHNVADNLRDTLSSALTIISKPDLTGLAPSLLKQATQTAVTFTGTGFLAGSNLGVTFTGAGVTATAVTYQSTTTLTGTVNVNASALTGVRSVILVNGDGGRDTLTGLFTVDTIITGVEPIQNAISYYDVARKLYVLLTELGYTITDSALGTFENTPFPPTGKSARGNDFVKFGDGSTKYLTHYWGADDDGVNNDTMLIGSTESIQWSRSGDTIKGSVAGASASVLGGIKYGSLLTGDPNNPQLADGAVAAETKISGVLPVSTIPSIFLNTSGAPLDVTSVVFIDALGNPKYADSSAVFNGGTSIEPETGFDFWEDFPQGGAAVNVNGNSAITATSGIGTHDWKLAGFGGTASVSLTFNSVSPSGVSPPRFGLGSLDASPATTMGVARGGWLGQNFGGASTYSWPVMAPGTYKFWITTPATTDSVGWMIGVVQRAFSAAVDYAALAATNEAILFHWGNSAIANDTLYATVIGNSVINRIALQTVSANTGYWLKCIVTASSVAFYVDGVLKTTVTTNLPATTEAGSPVIGLWNYGADAAGTGKNLIVDYYRFKWTGTGR